MFFLSPGRIPAWLQGTLLRNGPGMHTVGETRYNHWFDGLALLHSFTIGDGKSTVWLAMAAVTNDHQWSSLKQHAFNSLTVLEVGSLKCVSLG